jgi:large subunit ribosomal protein L6
MSKIGKQPIPIKENVEITQRGQDIVIKGPKGELSCSLPSQIKVEKKENELMVRRQDDSILARSLHGTWRALLQNAIEGVTEGFRKELELVGLGYRAEVKENNLVLQVGFSHPVEIKIPPEVKVEVEKTTITVEGIDKQKVGEIAAIIRRVRPPEPYKGTGIRYLGEVVRRKPGKAAKALGAVAAA